MATKPQQKHAVFAAIMAGLLGLTACGQGAGGEAASTSEFQLATFVGPSTPYGEALSDFAEKIKEDTDGRVSVEIFWDGSLLAGDEILDGVESGRAGMGYINTSYHPTELPLSQLVTIPFQANNTETAQAAWNELLETNADYAAEWEANNVVNLGIQSVTPMIISGKDEPTGTDWISGKRLRATSYTAQAVQLAGGSPVGLTINELYESIERGVIDGYTSMNLGTIPSLSLQEISPYVADPGLGIYSIVGLVVNQDAFDKLNAEDQEALRAAGKDLGENYLEVVDRVEDDACAAIKEAGGNVTVWDESKVNTWKDLVGDQLLESWKSEVGGTGKDADAFATAYADAIIANANDSEGALGRCAGQ